VIARLRNHWKTHESAEHPERMPRKIASHQGYRAARSTPGYLTLTPRGVRGHNPNKPTKEQNMMSIQKTNFARVAVVAVVLSLLPGIFSFAQDEELKPQKSKPEFIQATAEGTSTQLGRMIGINIIINEYSTAEDQKALIAAFTEKGNEGLTHALDKMKSKGRIAITGTRRTVPGKSDLSRTVRSPSAKPGRLPARWTTASPAAKSLLAKRRAKAWAPSSRFASSSSIRRSIWRSKPTRIPGNW
jgi:hypothetical protein